MNALLFALVVATTPVTLSEVRTASRANVQALLSELDLQRAAQNIVAARSTALPQLSLAGGVSGFSNGPQRVFSTVPVPNPDGTVGFTQKVVEVPGSSRGSFDLSVTATQLIYDGGKWWNRISQAGAQEEAASGQLEEQRMSSELEGVRRFYELYRVQRRKVSLEENVRRSEVQVERANGLFNAGRANKSDVLAAQVNLGNDRLALLQQDKAMAVAQADLAAWISRPASEDLEAVDAPLSEPSSIPDLHAAVDQAQRGRPLYRALQAQVRAAQEGEAVARGDYLPRVAASATLGRSGPSADPFFTDPTRQNYVTGGLNIRWDLFSGFATNANVRTAEANTSTAKLNEQQALRELSGDVKRALVAVTTQVAIARISDENHAIAEQSLQVAEGRFQSGAGSTLEVRDAQVKRVQAQLQKDEARIDLQLAQENLRRVMGASPEVKP